MADSAPSPVTPPLKTSAPRRNVNRTIIGLNVVLQLLLVLVIIAVLNTISYRHFQRWDLSHDQNYSLSPKTKALLSHLEQPVRAIVYFPQAQILAKDVPGLLTEYAYASGKKFTAEYVDPYKNLTRAKELSEQYKFGGNDNIVILDYKGKSKFVNAQDMVEFDETPTMPGQPPAMKAFKGEEAITSALQGLLDEKQNKLYVISGHGEPNLEQDPVLRFKVSVERENIKLEQKSLSNLDMIPADATGVMIFGPRSDYTERELQLLSEYWNQRKGRLFVALNPDAETPRLDEWLTEQGVKPQGDRILRTGAAPAMEGNQLVMRNGIYKSPTVTFAPAGRAVTKEMAGGEAALLGSTESLLENRTRSQAEKIRTTILMHSSEGFWGETEFAVGEGRTVFFDPKKDHIGPLVVALAVEKGVLEDPRVKVDTSRMIVIGNAGFLTDQGWQLSPQGLDFALASLNWIFNRELVSGIPPKPKQALSLSLTDEMVNSIFWATVVIVPLAAGVFGLYVSAFRRNLSLLTLTTWVLGIGLFVFGAGTTLGLYFDSKESAINPITLKSYLVPGILMIAPLVIFILYILKPMPSESAVTNEAA